MGVFDCFVCSTEYESVADRALDCFTCGNGLCDTCVMNWYQQCSSSQKPFTCPFCRGVWSVTEMSLPDIPEGQYGNPIIISDDEDGEDDDDLIVLDGFIHDQQEHVGGNQPVIINGEVDASDQRVLVDLEEQVANQHVQQLADHDDGQQVSEHVVDRQVADNQQDHGNNPADLSGNDGPADNGNESGADNFGHVFQEYVFVLNETEYVNFNSDID